MGIFQSVGGAATSGRGMTGEQYAQAIRAASLRKCSVVCAEAECRDRDAPLPADAYDEKDTFWVLPDGSVVEDAAGPHDSLLPGAADTGAGIPPTRVTQLAPRVFRRLRLLEGVPDDHFASEWKLPEAEAKLGEGRSMAMFVKSLNSDYMAKTIAEGEVGVLMGVLPKLVEHLTQQQHSMLMRFLMVAKLEAAGNVGFLLIFSDVFSTCPTVNERWDLKGRVPKPGKFLSFPAPAPVVRRDVAHVTTPAAALRRHRDDVATKATLHDEDAPEPVSPSDATIPTKKDKELTRLFWMARQDRDDVVRQLHADFNFLGSLGLMDYSVLIGVRYKDQAVGSPLRAGQHDRKDLAVSPKPRGESRAALGTQFGRGSAAQHESRARYHNGVESVLGEETYYIGVIDMLTAYTWKKQTANCCKGFLWTPETLSTIPPADYRARIADYMERIFVSPDAVPAGDSIEVPPPGGKADAGRAYRVPAPAEAEDNAV